MSLHMDADKSRLTVLGTGWTDTPVDSGEGLTIDGEVWRDAAIDFNYDIGGNVDWDIISANETPIDWSKVVYEDPAGNMYVDTDGDGVWRNPDTGVEYTGGGTRWIPEDTMVDIATDLEEIAEEDAELAQYDIEDVTLPSIYGGKVTTELEILHPGPNRPHMYHPAVFFIQYTAGEAVLFLEEAFFHSTPSGGFVPVEHEDVTVRDGSTKRVTWSTCETKFSDNILPPEYDGYPIQYVCWQCLYGSLHNVLVQPTENTITPEDIREDLTDLRKKMFGGITYYAKTRGGAFDGNIHGEL